MQVILLERVAKLGQMGDVVDVKPGYARNFLLPFGKAVNVTPSGLKQIERKKLINVKDLIDYDSDYDDTDKTVKVEECVPYEDYDSDPGKNFDNYEDPEWTGDSYRWTKTGDEPAVKKSKTKTEEEMPF